MGLFTHRKHKSVGIFLAINFVPLIVLGACSLIVIRLKVLKVLNLMKMNKMKLVMKTNAICVKNNF